MAFGFTPTPNQSTVAVTDAGQTLVRDKNPDRTNLIIQNIGTDNAWLRIGEDAVADASYKLEPGATFSMSELRALAEDNFSMDDVRAICSAGDSTTLFYLETVTP